MLSIYERHLFEEFASDFIAQVKNAIKTKPVRRKTKAQGGFSSTVNATGKLAESLRSEIDDAGIRVYCLAYIDKLVYGQPPQRIDATEFEIKNWINAKGLDLTATGVMNNLQRSGSSIWQEFGGQDSGLLGDVHFEKKLEEIKSKLTLKMIEDIGSEITKQFKVAA